MALAMRKPTNATRSATIANRGSEPRQCFHRIAACGGVAARSGRDPGCDGVGTHRGQPVNFKAMRSSFARWLNVRVPLMTGCATVARTHAHHLHESMQRLRVLTTFGKRRKRTLIFRCCGFWHTDCTDMLICLSIELPTVCFGPRYSPA